MSSTVFSSAARPPHQYDSIRNHMTLKGETLPNVTGINVVIEKGLGDLIQWAIGYGRPLLQP
jgi:hypothetical protein